jgi:ribosome-binding protein aMBF1 (putative translation factor)
MRGRRMRASLDAGDLGQVPVTVTLDASGSVVALWPRRADMDETDATQAELARLVDALADQVARARRQGASLAELARRAELAHSLARQLADIEAEQSAP